MNPVYIKSLSSQIRSVLDLAEKLLFIPNVKLEIPPQHFQQLLSSCLAVISRIENIDSVHVKCANEIMDGYGSEEYKLERLLGVIKSLQNSVENGYLQNMKALIHGELFDDFVVMAEHLLDEGYKDASAVIAGGTLESHLRKLCELHSIPTTINGGKRPKKADQMNNELASSIVYEKLDQKNVTAWLDLRNKAAHAEYEKYNSEQVRLMISGVRGFIARYPA